MFTQNLFQYTYHFPINMWTAENYPPSLSNYWQGTKLYIDEDLEDILKFKERYLITNISFSFK